jgi:hypothetical protein
MFRRTPLLGIMEAAAKAAVRPKTGAKSLLVWRYLGRRMYDVTKQGGILRNFGRILGNI